MPVQVEALAANPATLLALLATSGPDTFRGPVDLIVSRGLAQNALELSIQKLSVSTRGLCCWASPDGIDVETDQGVVVKHDRANGQVDVPTPSVLSERGWAPRELRQIGSASIRGLGSSSANGNDVTRC